VPPEKRAEVIVIVRLFRGRIVDVARGSLIVEMSGTEQKIEALIELLTPFGIKDLARTGVIAMARGKQRINDEAAERTPGKVTRRRSLDAPAAVALPPS
jgi:acetolactate synthase small subunit